MYKLRAFGAMVSSVLCLLLVIARVNSQGGLAEVTFEMFTTLQQEVNDLYGRLNPLQDQLANLGAKLDNLKKSASAISDLELAELQMLIDIANKQEEDISKLYYSNGLWQQNFRVINNTFERLRKVVVFPAPTLNNPSFTTAGLRRILPAIGHRKNMTIVRILPSPKPENFVKSAS